MENHDEQHDPMDSAIAIVGMACHLPGALNLEEYWRNLRDGVESIKFYSQEELREAGESAQALKNPNYVPAQPHLENYDRFDAGFWGFSPQDAAVTDPAHRLFLEVAYESLEHSGHTGYEDEGTVGVFASSGASLYWMENLRSNPQLIEDMGEFLVRHTGNDMNFLATRLSYELDLRGPSINVQTACSSALVCVHMAAQSLLSGECDMAIAGGSTVLLPQKRGYVYRDGEIMSPDGHCRPFDAKSAGTVFGSGAGSLVLRRLEDAIEDGDTIYGVVRGSAINNDGHQKIGYLAPSVDGQVGAIAEALAISEVDAGDISYVEAHGTGTQVGDPIEFEALKQVYGDATDKKQYCRLGSVKSNIGHLGEAAGAAAMIKVCLSLMHRELPASLNYERPNPQMDLENSPFTINASLSPWRSDQPLLAGVTALGAGGTNAHVILQEAPDLPATDVSEHSQHVLTLSAKTESALDSAARQLATALQRDSLDLADVAYTLQIGRRNYPFRRALPVSSLDDAVSKLEKLDAKETVSAKAPETSPSLIFMLPGGGAQYSGMGLELYQKEAVYRDAFDACLACLTPDLAVKVKSLVFAPAEDREQATVTLQTPTLTLTSLFATEYALAKQLQAWGATPKAMIGHSMGENTAACLAGVMSLNDAMNLVLIRGQLFERAPEGGMLSISLPLSEAKRFMPDTLDVAAVNSPDLCVATGAKHELEALQVALEAEDVNCSIVRINVAAHSRMLDGVLNDFRTYLRSIRLSPPEIPFTSNLTGTWITDKQATDPDYWVDHLRNTVKFAENIATVMADDSCVFVEVGPGRTLTNLAKANVPSGIPVLSTMRHPNDEDSDLQCALRSLGAMWCHGAAIEWSDFWGEEFRRRVPLPTYPFERKSYWIDWVESAAAPSLGQDNLEKIPDIAQWYAQLSWQQVPVKSVRERPAQNYLVFAQRDALSERLIHALQGRNVPVSVVYEAEQFQDNNSDEYSVNPNSLDDYQQLMDQVYPNGFSNSAIIYLWSSLASQHKPGDISDYQRAKSNYFWGLFNLAKALGEQDGEVSLIAVTNQAFSLAGETINVNASLAMGPVLVLPREMPHVRSKLVDVSLVDHPLATDRLAARLIEELEAQGSATQVAFRGRHRWERKIERVGIDGLAENSDWLNDARTVLISGGLGGIGLSMARRFAERGVKRLILISRSALPEKTLWPEIINSAATSQALRLKLSALQQIESAGAEVVAVAADITNPTQLAAALSAADVVLSDIKGVVHAAGVMDDKLLMEKSVSDVEAILSAKTEGALALDTLFEKEDLDFFVAFSSVASYLGLPGQVDYTSANAYLDAFIADRAERCHGKSLVVNWSAWKDVGMAAHLAGPETSQTLLESSSWSAYSDLSEGARVYTRRFSATNDWLIAEHKTRDGFFLLPGTGYIELAGAALHHYGDGRSFSLSNLQFLAAFEVPNAGERSLHVRLEEEGAGCQLTFFSEDEEMPLATMDASLEASACENGTTDLSALRARFGAALPTQSGFMDQVFMDFGPRWGCIEAISHQPREALVDLQLPEAFVGDLSTYRLHPALLDMATGCAQFLQDGFDRQHDFYVPVSYELIKVFSPLPARLVSHIALRSGTPSGFIIFDVMLMDDSGQCLSELKGFTMKKIEKGFASSLSPMLASEADTEELSPEQQRLSDILREAIEPQEGVDAFERLMSVNSMDTQFIIASIDTSVWQHQLAQQFSEQDERGGIQFIHELVHDPDADPDITEIEQIISANEGVEDVVVRSFLDDNERRRLIAFYVADDWSNLTVTDLRNDIQSKISEELMPQRFVQIDEFERDANGGIDRSVLTDPFAPVDHYIPPKTPTEKRLAKIWQGIVGVPRVALNENFFDIGGHSLLSIRVIVKVKKEFGVRLDQAKMVLLTLEQMANEIDQLSGAVDKAQQTQVLEPQAEAGDTMRSSEQPEKKGLFGSIFGKSKR